MFRILKLEFSKQIGEYSKSCQLAASVIIRLSKGFAEPAKRITLTLMPLPL